MADEPYLELLPSSSAEGINPKLVPLEKDLTVFGRSSNVDVQLCVQPDPALHADSTNIISRRHAEISKHSSGNQSRVRVRDLNSVNGVFVNDVKVHESDLQDGDKVQFGGAALLPLGARFFGNRAAIQYRYRETPPLPPQLQEAPPASSPRPAKRQRTAVTAVDEPAAPTPSPSSASSSSPGTSVAVTGMEASGAQQQSSAGRTSSSSSSSSGSSRRADAMAAAAELAQAQSEAASAQQRADALQHENTQLQIRLQQAEPAAQLAQALQRTNAELRSRLQEAEARSSSDNSISEQLKQLAVATLPLLACPLCKSMLLDAAVLPCGHACCRQCWSEHCTDSSTSSGGGGVSCPECSRRFHSSERRAARRSAHLDALVPLLVEALGSQQQRSSWATRQAVAAASAAAAAAAAEAIVAAATPLADAAAADFATPAQKLAAGRGAASAPAKAAGHTAAAAAAAVSSAKVAVKREAAESSRAPIAGHMGASPVKQASPLSAAAAALAAKKAAQWQTVLQSKDASAAKQQQQQQQSADEHRAATGSSDAAAAEAVVVCDGCNEPGHTMSSCPHRSDEALESEDEDEEEASSAVA
jgi:FHA domain/Zinc finger, C3HC4 type (RING finger)